MMSRITSADKAKQAHQISKAAIDAVVQVASKEEVTPQKLDAALASLKLDAGATAAQREAMLRMLGDVVATNSLGKQAPSISAALASEIQALPPSGKLRPMVPLAAELYIRALATPSELPVYLMAHAQRGMQLGLRIAIESQHAKDTEDRSGVRGALLEIVDKCVEREEIMAVAQAWAKLATPAGPGVWSVDKEALGVIAQMINELRMAVAGTKGEAMQMIGGAISQMAAQQRQDTAQAQADNASHDATIQAQLMAAGETAEAAGTAPAPTERSVGGVSPALLEKMYADATAKAQGGEFLYRISKCRKPEYATLIKQLREHPITQLIEPPLRRMLKQMEEGRRETEAWGHGQEITKDSPIATLDSEHKAVFELANNVAHRLGFGDEVSVLVAPEPWVNAYIYTADAMRPRVVVTDPLLRRLWSDEKNDWIHIGIDANGNAVADGSSSAVSSLPVGKLIAEAVIAHELGHIRDEVVFHRLVLMVLTGQFGRAAAGEDDARNMKFSSPLEQLEHAREQAIVEAAKVALGNDEIKQIVANFDPADLRDFLKQALGSNSMYMAAARGGGMTDHVMMSFTRQAEHTADHMAVALQGTGKHMANFFMLLNTQAEAGTEGERVRRLIDIYNRDPRAFAEGKVDQATKSKVQGGSALSINRTHPFPPLRIIDNSNFEKGEFVKQLQEVLSLPPHIRLVAAAQAVDAAAERLQDDIHRKSIEPNFDPTSALMEARQGTEAKRALLERMDPIVAAVATLVLKDGPSPQSYAMEILRFLGDGGVKLNAQTVVSLGGMMGGQGGGIAQVPAMGYEFVSKLQEVIAAEVAKLPTKAEQDAWAPILVAYDQYRVTVGGAIEKLRAHKEAEAKMLSRMQEHRNGSSLF